MSRCDSVALVSAAPVVADGSAPVIEQTFVPRCILDAGHEGDHSAQWTVRWSGGVVR